MTIKNNAPFGLPWRFWIAAIISAFWMLLVGVTTFYTFRASIPPFEQLQRAHGVLGVERINVRAGDRTQLRLVDGSVQAFSCRDGDGERHTCFVDVKHQWVGKAATIWWCPIEINPWQIDRHVVQLMVGSEMVIAEQKAVQKLQSSKSWRIGVGGFVFFVAVAFLINEYNRGRRKYAAQHR